MNVSKGKKGFQRVSVTESFWSKVEFVDFESGCWRWTGRKNAGGYGVAVMDRKPIPAHRLAWLLLFGELPCKHLYLCHHCDNPECVNPDHLFVGSAKDNMRDAAAKKRLWVQNNPTAPRGPSRVNAEKTHCIAGHPLSGSNVRITFWKRKRMRRCVECDRKRDREAKRRKSRVEA